MTYKKRKFF